MRLWYHHILETQRSVAEVVGSPVRIGRHADNDIVLANPFVSDFAVVLEKSNDHWELTSLGANGCKVDDAPLRRGARAVLSDSSRVTVFPFQLALDPSDEVTETTKRAVASRNAELSLLERDVHARLLALMDAGTQQIPDGESGEGVLILERNIEEIARQEGINDPGRSDRLIHIAGCCVRGEMIERLIGALESPRTSGSVCEARSEPPRSEPLRSAAPWSRLVTTNPERERDLNRCVESLFASLRLSEIDDLSDRIQAVERGFESVWAETAAALFEEFLVYLALRYLKKRIKDILFGYGPLEDLLREPSITEIMVVSRDKIYIEKNGIVENSGREFVSDEVTETIIERIVSQVGRRIDKSTPLVDARLVDGSRVNAVIAPIAVSGPCLTIRKFPLRRLTVDDLVALDSLPASVADFLRAAVIARKSIVISGGTGSGKTTLLNCLAEYIPEKERVITIEDTAELQIHKEHVARLETKKANIEGAGAYEIRDLVKNALRMRPDRIVVGECRGGEALDMLQAMNTGHEGSLTTIHANSPADIVLRLEVMVQSAARLPIESIHRQIGSAIDLIVHIERTPGGKRRVCRIAELLGYDETFGGVRMKDLFTTESTGDDASLLPTGRLPTFMGDLLDRNDIRLETFYL